MPGGKSPKPTRMHLVEGTLNVTKHRNRKEEVVCKTPLKKPPTVTGRAEEVWNDMVRIAYWLTEADSHTLANWCKLVAKAEKNFNKFNASMIAQFRGLGSVLGFDPASRTRINAGQAIGNKTGDEKKANKFFA